LLEISEDVEKNFLEGSLSRGKKEEIIMEDLIKRRSERLSKLRSHKYGEKKISTKTKKPIKILKGRKTNENFFERKKKSSPKKKKNRK
jgi:asparagine synthetase B (glutamine-hydrolysing)